MIYSINTSQVLIFFFKERDCLLKKIIGKESLLWNMLGTSSAAKKGSDVKNLSLPGEGVISTFLSGTAKSTGKFYSKIFLYIIEVLSVKKLRILIVIQSLSYSQIR